MTDDELKSLFDALRQDNVGLRQDNAALRQENAAAHVETRRHFEVIAERLEKKIDVVAEAVATVDLQARVERLETSTH